MNRGLELMTLYLDAHCPPPTADEPLEEVSGDLLQQLLWPLVHPLRERHAILKRVAVNFGFAEEADKALLMLAISGSFEDWATFSAGAWKIIECRWSWAMVATRLEAAMGTDFSIQLPRGAPEQARSTAAILYVLGTPARNPPAEWLAQYPVADLEEFLAKLPPWRQ